MTRPVQRVALGGLVVACLLAAAAYATAFRPGGAPVLAAVVLAFATALLMAALVVLGAGAGGRGALAVAVVTLLGVVGGGVAGALLLDVPSGADAPLFGGLPAGVALLVYGAGVVPAVIVPLVYAWTFDRAILRPDVLDEARRRGRAFERRESSHDDGPAT